MIQSVQPVPPVCKCPYCLGKKSFFAIAFSPGGPRVLTHDCPLCLGTGTITGQLRELYREDLRAGEKMRQRRLERGAGVVEDAAALGISVDQLQRSENGLTRAPKPVPIQGEVNQGRT